MKPPDVLQLCSYWVGSDLFQPFLAALTETGGVRSLCYVPTTARRYPSSVPPGVLPSACFSEWERLFFYRKHGRILNDLQSRIDPRSFALAHAHSLFSNGYLALGLKERYGLPYVVAVRSTDLNVFFRYRIQLRPLGRRILREAERVVFLSPAYLETLGRKYLPAAEGEALRAKAVILPNGIDSYWLEHRTARVRAPGRTLKLIHAGSIIRRKNPLTTAAACRLLRSQGFDVRFTLVGRAVNKVLTARLKREPGVVVLPAQPREELARLYRDHDILVMPSHHETFGLVYPEAMSQGLPVVYTKGQGFDGQFPEGEVGYGVADDDAPGIAAAVLAILEDYNAMSARCAAASARFDWRLLAASYAELYRAVLNVPNDLVDSPEEVRP